MCQINVRPMREEDIEQIVEIEKLSFPTPWSAYAFRCELEDNKFAHYLVLTDSQASSKVVGYGGMWVIIDEAHVTNIAFLPEYRGKGLGKILLLAILQLAFSKGAKSITLEVRVSNEQAQNLYRKMGFRAVGIRKNYYTDNNEDAYLMWAPLPVEI